MIGLLDVFDSCEKDEICQDCRKLRRIAFKDHAWGATATFYEYYCALETDPENEDCVRHDKWLKRHPKEDDEEDEYEREDVNQY